jgi:hypothetical protein
VNYPPASLTHSGLSTHAPARLEESMGVKDLDDLLERL